MNEKIWHRRIGRGLSGVLFEKGKKKRKHCATAQLIVFASH